MIAWNIGKRLGMTAFTFDAIEHLKRLKQDGFTEAQAESVIKIARDVQETNLSFIATKADTERLDSKFDTVAERLDSKIDSIKAELKADIRELELRMHNKIAQGTITIVKWIAAVLVLQVLSPLVQSILPLLKAH